MRKAILLLVLALLVALPASAQEEMPEFITESHTACEVDLTGQTVTINHFGHDITGLYMQHKLLLSNLRTDLV